MATLYELTDDYILLMEMAEDPEIEPEVFADTLEGIAGAIEDKAEGYAKVMRMLAGDVEAIKAEERRLKARRDTIESNIKRMKASLQYAMEMTGKRKFKTQLFSFGIQKNPASVVVDETYIENIPERFLIARDPDVDKKALKEAINAGDEEAMGVAHLEQTESLRIR